MTISSTSRKAGPFIGNGVATTFTFNYKVFLRSDVVATLRAISSGLETTLILDTDYTVTLNADQNTNPGGIVTYNPAGTPMSSSYTLTLTSGVLQNQGTNIPNAGGWYPEVVENALDKATILIQQLSEIVARTLRIPVSSTADPTLPTPAPGGFGWNASGTAIVNYVFQAGTSLVDLAANAGATLIGYLSAGTGAVKRTVASKLSDHIHVNDFGADPTGVLDSTGAFHKARDYANSLGGAIVHVGPGNYTISQFTFGTSTNVTLQGESNGYGYDSDIGGGTRLNCVTGVWAVRIPYGSVYCGLRDLIITSNGALSMVMPFPVSVAGVEYGVLIEQGASFMRNVTVRGFQYGCGIASLGNSNVFEYCSFVWNTRCGFFVTLGSAAAYALHHPNLTIGAAFSQTTQIWIRNCIFRRNAWGIILRDGDGTFDSCIVESNFFGGLMQYIGAGDGTNSYDFINKTHFEANWSGYNNSNADYATSAVNSNNLLLDTAGVHMAWTNSATLALDYAGYQIYMMSSASGTGAGPQQGVFDNTRMVVSAPQKIAFLLSCYRPKFINGTDGGGGAASWRLGDGSIGGYYANSVGFENYKFSNAPTTWGNRGYYFIEDPSYDGGLIWQVGSPKSAYGQYVGSVVNGDYTVNGATVNIDYMRLGPMLVMHVNANVSGTSAAVTFRVDGAPASICPAAGTKQSSAVRVQDNGAVATWGYATLGSNGRLTLYKDPNGSDNWTAAGTKALLQCTMVFWG